MSIIKNGGVFKLDTKNTSYIMKVVETSHLLHLYYGATIEDFDLECPFDLKCMSATVADNPFENENFSLDSVPQEFSGNGCADFRLSSIAVLDNSGYNSVDLRFKDYKITKEKPEFVGMPSAYDCDNDSETLEIIMEDTVRKIEVSLFYTVFYNADFITRSTKITNVSTENVFVERAMSACIDFPNYNYDLIGLHGSWANERYEQRTPIKLGTQGFNSKRGISSHQHNPFCIVCEQDATENFGNAYAFGLVYSGNHLLEIEKSQTDTSRLIMGINPDDFAWKLESGESFQTPEVMMAFSENGFNELSQTFAHAIRHNICRGTWKLKRRPIVINNWEATYFNFDEDKIFELASEAKSLGIEMFVLDDGWFGKRDDDSTSLGDWFVHSGKFPNGISSLCKKLQDIDMKFGLWIEPEMISKDSELHRKHSDWVLSQEGRGRSVGRHQYVLDFSRKEVVDSIWNQLNEILSKNPISYIKWDMNRTLTEAGSLLLTPDRKKEVYHRYVLGVYDLMNRLVTTYPDLLLENCSSGGARFDLAMLCYSPQIWTSDNSDAIERVAIQYGTSYAYPISCMGAHVSASPNHQLGRTTSIDVRGNVAMFGAFGYELDLSKVPEEDKEIIKKQCEFYKEHALTIQNGKFYRIQTSLNSTFAAWQVVSEDEKDIFVLYVTIKGGKSKPLKFIKLPYANKNMTYTDAETGAKFHGTTLVKRGFYIEDVRQDFSSKLIHFKGE